MQPVISFIIPAYNAQHTLRECYQSLSRQTITGWEAVIVDDGSSDDTFALACELADEDPRVKVLQQPNAGASKARNVAVLHATADHICMLDADDWVDSQFIAAMLPVAQAGDGKVIAYCSYRYASDDGTPLAIDWAPDLTGDNAKIVFSERCAIGIHCAVLPRAAFGLIGGLNTELATCEDWEFWVKLAFGGYSFQEVKQCLCYYRRHANTLSGNPYNVVADAVRVIASARAMLARDFGEASQQVRDYRDRETRIAIWYSAMFAAHGVKPRLLFELLPALYDFSGREKLIAGIVVTGLLTGMPGSDIGDVVAAHDVWLPAIRDMLGRLEEAGLGGIERQTLIEIAKRLQSKKPANTLCWQLGPVLVASVDTHLPQPIAKPAGADVLVVHFYSRGKKAGFQELPLYADIDAQDLRMVLRGHVHFRAMLWLKDPGLYKRLAKIAFRNRSVLAASLVQKQGRGTVVRNLLMEAIGASRPRSTSPTPQVLAEDSILARARDVSAIPSLEVDVGVLDRQVRADARAVGSIDKAEFWDDFFDNEDPWDYLSVYETRKYEQTLELIPAHSRTALEIACAEGIFTRYLSSRVANLTATDISSKALSRAEQRCGKDSGIKFRQLDLKNDDLPADLDLIVCSEVLYYLRDKSELVKVAAKFCDALTPGGIFVTAHAYLISDSPNRTGFDWDEPYGVETIRNVFADTEGLVLEKSIETELYAIHRFRKAGTTAEAVAPIASKKDFGEPLTTAVSKHIVWGGGVISRGRAWNSETTMDIPVLMYHRVSTDAPDALREYQVTPELFESQLRYLRQRGYYGLTASSLAKNLRSGRPLRGRPILITFDDGYQDFADVAAPLLLHYGFSAEVFLVADKVGQAADWDAPNGAAASLMDWDTIGKLQSEDIRFGSHLCTHRPATSLTSQELLYEAAHSRAVIEKKLGKPVAAVALPYGLYGTRVEHVLQSAGYDIAFSTDPGIARPGGNMMRVPRTNIGGSIALETFVKLLGRR